MSLTIDEVTAEVAPPESAAPSGPRTVSPPSAASEQRRVREQLERQQQRALRLAAD